MHMSRIVLHEITTLLTLIPNRTKQLNTNLLTFKIKGVSWMKQDKWSALNISMKGGVMCLVVIDFLIIEVNIWNSCPYNDGCDNQTVDDLETITGNMTRFYSPHLDVNA